MFTCPSSRLRRRPAVLVRAGMVALAALVGCASDDPAFVAQPAAVVDDAAWAAGPTLSLGDPAPALGEVEWLRGEPFDPAGGRRTSVVVFWAPWCGPCHAVMPRIRALERVHEARVVVIAAATPDAAAPASRIRRDVEAAPEAFPARAVLDDGHLRARWRRAALEGGVPRAFVVDPSGRVAWIGHPADAAPVVKAVTEGTEGTWDLAAAARERTAYVRDRREARRLLAVLERADAGASEEAVDRVLEALAALDPAALSVSPPESIALRRARRLAAGGDADAAAACLVRAARAPAFARDGHALAALALALVDVDSAAAAEVADRAETQLRVEAERARAGDAWDRWIADHPASSRGPAALAAVRFAQGRPGEAVAWQERAVALLRGPGIPGLDDAARRTLARDRAALADG